MNFELELDACCFYFLFFIFNSESEHSSSRLSHSAHYIELL